MYVVKTGCQWIALSHDYPPYSTVYNFYSRAKQKGVWEKVMQFLVKETQIQAGRNAEPGYTLIDSQSVKQHITVIKKDMTGEKTKGIKRHIVTDIMGNILAVNVNAANIHDTNGGVFTFEKALSIIRQSEEYVPIMLTENISDKYLKNFIILEWIFQNI